MPSADLVYRFLGIDAGAGASFDRMAGKTALLGKSSSTAEKAITKLALGAGVLGTVIGVESVKAAAKFQTALTKIHTQADASYATVAKLRTGILGMTTAVATSPTTLAAAAFHIASVGQHSLTAAQQLRVLRIAAEGAKLGGADLVDVTNALDAAIVSHIRGVKNYSQAMGVLNATVGAGDMQMQDLAEAFGPLGAVMKGYNVDIRQVGAALATFGDNNLRGAQAGTALRMAVQSLAVPMKAGRDILKSWGISSGNLANQLRHGGLTDALDTLEQAMKRNGVTGKEVGDVLTQAFGKRAGVGLAVLIGELDRYHAKLGEVSKGATGFASSWAGYTKTFQYSFDQMRTSVERAAIELGTALLPTATKLANYFTNHVIPDLSSVAHWIDRNSGFVKTLTKLLVVSFVAWKTYTLWTRAAAAATKLFGISTVAASGEIVGSTGIVAALSAATKAGYGWLAVGRQISLMGPMLVGAMKDQQNTASLKGGIFSAFGPNSDAIKQTLQSAAGIQFYAKAYHDLIVQIQGASGAERQHLQTELQQTNAIAQSLGVLGSLRDAAFAAAGGWTAYANSIAAAGAEAMAWQNAQGYGTGSNSPFVDPGHPGYKGGGAPKHKSKFLLPGGAGVPIVAPSVGAGGAAAAASAANVLHITARRLVKALASGLLNGWQGFSMTVKDSLSTGTRNLLDQLEKQFQKVTDGMAKLVKDARTKLANDLKAQTQFVQQMMSDAALSNVPTVDSGFTGQTTRLSNINAFLGSQAANYALFAKDLKRVAHMGLGKGLLNQIAQMGPTAGLQYLQQILANPSMIGQLNAYQKQIATSAKAIGKDQYGSQIQADRRNLHRQTELQERMAHRLDHLADDIANKIAAKVDPKGNVSGKPAGLSVHEAKQLQRDLNKLDRLVGKKR